MVHKDPEKGKEYRRKWQREHRENMRMANKKYRQTHKDKIKEYIEKNKKRINKYKRLWRAKKRKENPELFRKKLNDWRAKNIERIRRQNLIYHKAHPEIRRRANLKHRHKYRMIVLVHYGGNPPKCACCGESEIKFLTIDHINNDGAKQWREKGFNPRLRSSYIADYLITNNFPEGFQVLCYNCNCGKAKNNGVCPHKQQKI